MIEDVESGLTGQEQEQEQSQFTSDELAGAGFEPESDDDNQTYYAKETAIL